MLFTRSYIILLFLCTCIGCPVTAQTLSFRHLGIDESMPSNLTSHACFDSSGLVWISTYDGLIGYDGTRVHQYLVETHPALPSNILEYLYCDSHNRIWICSEQGLTMMDERRQLRRINISDTMRNRNMQSCVEIPGVGMLVLTSSGTFLLPENSNSWQHYNWFDDSVRKGSFTSRIQVLADGSGYLLCRRQLMRIDFRKQEIKWSVAAPDAAITCHTPKGELVALAGNPLRLLRFDTRDGKQLSAITLQAADGSVVPDNAVSMDYGADGKFYFSTRTHGLCELDPLSGKLILHRHDPLNKYSISSDNLRRVQCSPSGYLAVTSATGFNITNLLVPSLSQQNRFADNEGRVIDNVVMCGDDLQGRIWLSNARNLMAWRPGAARATAIPLPAAFEDTQPGSSEAGSIFRDTLNRMWVSINGKGLVLYHPDGRLFRFFTPQKDGLPSDKIRIIRQLGPRQLIAGTDDGLFLIHTGSFRFDTFPQQHPLAALAHKRIVDIFRDGAITWIAASPDGGAYRYDAMTATLKILTTKEGLSSNRVYCITKDLAGAVYIGTYDGLNILYPDGQITRLTKQNGLRHARVDNLVTDPFGRIWITNFHTLICYTPSTKTFQYFDEQNGVSNAGFTVGQRLVTRDSLLLFCNNGLLQADSRLLPLPAGFAPALHVNRMYPDGSYDLLEPGERLTLPYNKASITFYYLANTLLSANRFFYRYRLDGLDTGWQQPVKNNLVTYNLRPGHYRFRVQVSDKQGEWISYGEGITIRIDPPLWQTTGFRVLLSAVLALSLYLLYRWRIRNIQAKEIVKRQLAELEGKALRAQMNPHFIFNSLNAIQELFITGHTEDGYRYLSSFSRLLRLVLHHSEKSSITLSSEIEMITLYLSLEALRFRQSFHHEIQADDSLETELLAIPPLLLQPYVENAIWHGLRTKNGPKNIWITLQEENEQLRITIEDNGVGRAAAAALKQSKTAANQFESKGMRLAEERIALLGKKETGTAQVTITDLTDTAGQPCGTRVTLLIPLYYTS